jgi:hypothetical protein
MIKVLENVNIKELEEKFDLKIFKKKKYIQIYGKMTKRTNYLKS